MQKSWNVATKPTAYAAVCVQGHGLSSGPAPWRSFTQSPHAMISRHRYALVGGSTKLCSGSAAQIQPLFATEYLGGREAGKYGSTSGLPQGASLGQSVLGAGGRGGRCADLAQPGAFFVEPGPRCRRFPCSLHGHTVTGDQGRWLQHPPRRRQARHNCPRLPPHPTSNQAHVLAV